MTWRSPLPGWSADAGVAAAHARCEKLGSGDRETAALFDGDLSTSSLVLDVPLSTLKRRT